MTRSLGLEITRTTIRLALVRSRYRRTTIEALREERCADHESRSAAIRATLGSLKCDAVASALAGERTFLRLLSLPATAAKELANVLSYEVEATLPFEIDDAVMDHRMLKHAPDTDPEGQLPILAGVAFTEEVRDHIDLVLRGTGHEPQRVAIGSLPLSNLIQLIPELGRGQVAILELGEDNADLLILRDGEPRFARSTSQGLAGLPAAASVIARDLRQTIGAWRVQGGAPLGAIYVVGTGHEVEGLDAFIQSQLGVPVLPLPKPMLDGLSPDQAARLPRFAKALGLAMSLSRRPRDLNMRQGALEAQQSFQFLRDKTPLLAGLTAAIFVSFGFSVFAETRELDSSHATLQHQLENATQAHFGHKTGDLTEADELLSNAITGKTGDPMPTMDAFDVMVEVSKRIPAEVVHDIADFEYNRGEVTIKGIVPAISDANLVKDKMAEHECFNDAKISGTTQLKNQDKQKYTLEFSVRCQADEQSKGKKGKKSKKGKGSSKPGTGKGGDK